VIFVIIFFGWFSGITRTSSTTSSDNGGGGHQEGRSTESVSFFITIPSLLNVFDIF